MLVRYIHIPIPIRPLSLADPCLLIPVIFHLAFFCFSRQAVRLLDPYQLPRSLRHASE
jgi:hypothetical protein